MPTIVSQIETLEKNLEKCRHRLNMMTGSLTDEDRTLEERKKLKEEAKYLTEEVKEFEKELKQLRKENRRTMLVSVVFFLLCLSAYFVYSTLM